MSHRSECGVDHKHRQTFKLRSMRSMINKSYTGVLWLQQVRADNSSRSITAPPIAARTP
jgi:hypothetical protein